MRDGIQIKPCIFLTFTKHLQNPIDFGLSIYYNKYSKNYGDYHEKYLWSKNETAMNNLICMNLEITGYDPVVYFDVIITVPRVGYRMEVSEWIW